MIQKVHTVAAQAGFFVDFIEYKGHLFGGALLCFYSFRARFFIWI
jgi:hypothetical protein